jgi:hypothetical protein
MLYVIVRRKAGDAVLGFSIPLFLDQLSKCVRVEEEQSPEVQVWQRDLPRHVSAFKSHFVTDGSETVGIGRNDRGTSAADNPGRITLFGNGRDRLESPSVGSTPGHPKKYCPYFTGVSAALVPDSSQFCHRFRSTARVT